MDGIESFNEAKNMARVAAGWKGDAKFFQKFQTYATYPFVEGWPPEVSAKLHATSIPQPTPTDPWMSRKK